MFCSEAEHRIWAVSEQDRSTLNTSMQNQICYSVDINPPQMLDTLTMYRTRNDRSEFMNSTLSEAVECACMYKGQNYAPTIDTLLQNGAQTNAYTKGQKTINLALKNDLAGIVHLFLKHGYKCKPQNCNLLYLPEPYHQNEMVVAVNAGAVNAAMELLLWTSNPFIWDSHSCLDYINLTDYRPQNMGFVSALLDIFPAIYPKLAERARYQKLMGTYRGTAVEKMVDRLLQGRREPSRLRKQCARAFWQYLLLRTPAKTRRQYIPDVIEQIPWPDHMKRFIDMPTLEGAMRKAGLLE